MIKLGHTPRGIQFIQASKCKRSPWRAVAPKDQQKTPEKNPSSGGLNGHPNLKKIRVKVN